MREKTINWLIKFFNIDTDKISDGYHTFGELYEHRFNLWIALCDKVEDNWNQTRVWKTIRNNDGIIIDDWFILGMDRLEGSQKTYHLPMKYWDRCSRFKTIYKPDWYDGHTSQDVIERLKNL